LTGRVEFQVQPAQLDGGIQREDDIAVPRSATCPLASAAAGGVWKMYNRKNSCCAIGYLLQTGTGNLVRNNLRKNVYDFYAGVKKFYVLVTC